VILWKGGNDIESDPDGGWNSSSFPVDKDKSYRYTVWIKRTGGTNGSFYFGAAGGELTYLNGTAE